MNEGSSESTGGINSELSVPERKGVLTLLRPENSLITLQSGADIMERKALSVRKVFVARPDGSTNEAEIRTRGSIWPEVYFLEHPRYIDSLDGNKAWGRTPEEALAKVPQVPRHSSMLYPMRSLADHFGSKERALDTFPIVYDETSIARLSQSLAESFAFAACMAPETASFDDIVMKEHIIPMAIYRYLGGLTPLFQRIKTVMQTVKILADSGQGDTLQALIPSLIGACGNMTHEFVSANAEKLGLISHLTMDEESRASAANILDQLSFEK